MQITGMESGSTVCHVTLSSLSRPALPCGVVVKVRYVLGKCLMLLPLSVQLPSLWISPCNLLYLEMLKGNIPFIIKTSQRQFRYLFFLHLVQRLPLKIVHK